MRKLLASKKGQIPVTDVLGNIFSGIRSFISWFIAVIPKPLLAIIFLFFILFLANIIIPLTANSFGYYCDGNGQVWKIPAKEIFDKFDLMRNKPEIDEGDTLKVPFMCFGKSTGRTLNYCSNCSFDADAYGSCSTDGYRLDDYSGIGLSFYCNWLGCAPPENYFLDISEQKFVCNAPACINATLIEYNNKFLEIEGGTPIYMDEGDNRSVTQMIYFKCQNENPTNIRLTLFGIDIFNYKIWVALLVIGALLYVISLKK